MRGLFDGHQPGQKGEDGIAPADPVSERERDRVILKQASVGLEPDAECPGEHGDGHNIEQFHSIVEAGRKGMELEIEQHDEKGEQRASNAELSGTADYLRLVTNPHVVASLRLTNGGETPIGLVL